MKSKVNILIYPCGSENAIELHTALKDIVNIRLYGASGKKDHGQYVFKNYIKHFPYIHDKNFISELNRITDKYSIDIIFPTHDDISLFIAKNRKKIKAKVAVPGYKQAFICRSKIKTYGFFKEYDFCPKVIKDLSEVTKFPIFIKPDKGQGAKEAKLIYTYDKWVDEGIKKQNFVATEYLPGDEYTVDCFSDKMNNLLFIGPRIRERIFGGICVNSRTVKPSKGLIRIANIINEKLKMRGLWFFQVKKNAIGQYKLLEISVRTSGTMNLYRGLGVNFPLLTAYDILNYNLEIITNKYNLEVDRYLANRYLNNLKYKNVYIDFDDTILKRDCININVMQYLYYCKNKGLKVFLITRHKGDIHRTLNNYAISPNLFEKIIIVSDNAIKSDYIKNFGNTIFIDNSFNERRLVKLKTNIPVFDIDAISTLIDWRE